MKTIKTALSCLLAVGVLPAFATPAVFGTDFEDAAAQVKNTLQPAADFKFSDGAFTIAGDALVAYSAVDNGPGHFQGRVNAPDDYTNLGALLLGNLNDPDPSSATMKVTLSKAFTGTFSLDVAGSGSFSLTSGQDSWTGSTSGTPVACLNEAGGVDDTVYCNWVHLSFDLDSVTSFAITGINFGQFFDNFSFAALDSNPPGTVPEPGGIALTIAALGALGWTRRRGGSRL